MKTVCEKWKEQLLEAALTGAVSADLAEHLRACKDCTAGLHALEARRERLDALLPLVAQSAQPSAGFRARVLESAEADNERKPTARWRVRTLAGAAATAAIVLVVGTVWHRAITGKIAPDEVATAQKLAEWRAPSDTLLATPGQEILRATPKLGESYLHVPVERTEEE